MKCVAALVPLVVLVVACLLSSGSACGPRYNDLYNGLQEPLRPSLSTVAYHLYHPSSDRQQRRKAFNDAYAAAIKAEKASQWQAAALAWKQVLQHGEGHFMLAQSDDLRRVKDRIEVCALDGVGDDLRQLYLRYVDHLTFKVMGSPLPPALEAAWGMRGSDAPAQRARSAWHRHVHAPVDQRRLIESPLADFVLLSKAWLLMRRGNFDACVDVCNSVLQGQGDQVSKKADEAAYMRLWAPIRLRLRDDTVKYEQYRELAERLESYASKADAGWKAQALGWLAMLRYYNSGDKKQGAAAALPVYWQLLDDPSLQGMHHEAVESSLLCYYHMPVSAWVGQRPEHAFLYLLWRVRRGHIQLLHEQKALVSLALQVFDKDGAVNVAVRDHLSPATRMRLSEAALALRRPQVVKNLCQDLDGAEVRLQAWYVMARAELQEGSHERAAALFERILAKNAGFDHLYDLGLRIAQLHRQAGDLISCLDWCIRVDAYTDVAILTDGEIPLEQLQAYVDKGRIPGIACPSRGGSTHGWPAIRNYAEIVKQRLGKRLVRHGQYKQAHAFLNGDTLDRLQQLQGAITDEEQSRKQDEAVQSIATYALGAAWYHHGPKLLYNDRFWHQWAFRRMWDPGQGRGAVFKQREAELLAMTSYHRALPLFERVAKQWPDSPEAPKALYSMGLCYYWLSGSTYLRYCPYWVDRAAKESFMERGHKAMRQLQKRYPDHPLARSEWVRKKVPAALQAKP